MRESVRYIGIELAGAKNNKTALAVLEHYPKEKKLFLLDLHDRISGVQSKQGPPSNDLAFVNLIEDLRHEPSSSDAEKTQLGVNVPLELPPCITCTRKNCPMPSHCTVPSVKWMRQIHRKNRGRDFTPYTQRPVELWLRHSVLPELPEWAEFEIDETLGGNRAPLTARMNFLKRHLANLPIIEVLPKLSMAILAVHLGIHRRIASTYRHLEQGGHSREEIIERLSEAHGLFIYERDVRKLTTSLAAFDAFICAYTALLAHHGKTEKAPNGFPHSSGWIHYPKLKLRSS